MSEAKEVEPKRKGRGSRGRAWQQGIIVHHEWAHDELAF